MEPAQAFELVGSQGRGQKTFGVDGVGRRAQIGQSLFKPSAGLDAKPIGAGWGVALVACDSAPERAGDVHGLGEADAFFLGPGLDGFEAAQSGAKAIRIGQDPLAADACEPIGGGVKKFNF